jgi:hypothetical protein
MSSELLGSAENALKGNLGGAWDILSGYADAYTDLGIGRKFGGAAAAYSLRDVGAMNGPVVRVRRDSDNAEQDFSALAVPYIPEWCNRQVIKPLDVKALQSDGRTGDFIIAKAAYSLRSLGDRQATVAATNDTVARADGKYVVQVRRNVDGTIKSFTADEVSDGTLASFVNESFTSSLPLDVQGSAAAAYSLRDLKTGGTSVTSSGDTAGDTTSNYVVQVRRSSDDRIKSFTAESITNGDLVSFVTEEQVGWNVQPTWAVSSGDASISSQSSTATTSTVSFSTTSSTSIIRDSSKPNHIVASSGDKVVANITTSGLSGSPVVRLRTSGTNTDVANVSLQSGTNDHTLTLTGDAGYFIYTGLDATSGATITINSVKVIAQSGHVTTWYDQSGNDNHATQGTADSQPKIVDAGSLVSLGVDFTGGKFMPFTSISAKTITAVNQLTDTTNFNYLVGRSSGDGGVRTSSGNGLFTGQDTASSASADFNNAGGTTHLNSSQSSFLSTNANVYFGTVTSGFAVTALGTAFEFSGVARSWRGKIAEVIIYTTDQSENRRAIEESMQGNYSSSITLGSFSRDGMVRTWYDQSVSDQGSTATGNHAVQATADNQPKVVSNGVLEDGIKFAASNDGSNQDILQVATRLGTTTDHFVTTVISKYQTAATAFGGIISTRLSNSGYSYGIKADSKPQVFYYASSGNGNSNATAALANDCPRTILSFDKDGDTLTGFTNGATNGISISQGFDTPSSTITNIGVAGSVTSPTDTGLQCNIDELIVYETDQADNQGAFEANIAEHYNISGVPAEDNEVNGFVETWYDQSGNGRDAVQATSTNQPKIVSSGSLVTGGIVFDSGEFLEKGSLSVSSPLNTFVVSTADTDHNGTILKLGTNTSQQYRTSTKLLLQYGSDLSFSDASIYTVGQQNLQSFQFVAGTSVGFFNGTQVISFTTSGETIDKFRIGNSTIGLDGKINEVILYNSDQSSERTAIESNINNHYSIF